MKSFSLKSAIFFAAFVSTLSVASAQVNDNQIGLSKLCNGQTQVACRNARDLSSFSQKEIDEYNNRNGNSARQSAPPSRSLQEMEDAYKKGTLGQMIREDARVSAGNSKASTPVLPKTPDLKLGVGGENKALSNPKQTVSISKSQNFGVGGSNINGIAAAHGMATTFSSLVEMAESHKGDRCFHYGQCGKSKNKNKKKHSGMQKRNHVSAQDAARFMQIGIGILSIVGR